jgi:hypothetical protein
MTAWDRHNPFYISLFKLLYRCCQCMIVETSVPLLSMHECRKKLPPDFVSCIACLPWLYVCVFQRAYYSCPPVAQNGVGLVTGDTATLVSLGGTLLSGCYACAVHKALFLHKSCFQHTHTHTRTHMNRMSWGKPEATICYWSCCSKLWNDLVSTHLSDTNTQFLVSNIYFNML